MSAGTLEAGKEAPGGHLPPLRERPEEEAPGGLPRGRSTPPAAASPFDAPAAPVRSPPAVSEVASTLRRLRLVPHRTLPQEDGKLLTALEHDEDGLLRCPTLRAQLQP